MGTAGAKVTVASKLPMALEMQCCKAVKQNVPGIGGMREQKVFYKTGEMHVINGTAYPNGQVPAGMAAKPQMIAGAALTFNVSKDLFDAWMIENAESSVVKNKLIWADEKVDDVKAVAKENKAVDSGLGPLVPDTDRRMPRKIVGRQARALAESEAE